VRVYFEPRDIWVGYYRGPNHHYVCPLPMLVIRWPNAGRRSLEKRLAKSLVSRTVVLLPPEDR
jgi:hypothetical protein